MKRKFIQSVIALALVAGAVSVGNAMATPGAGAALSKGQQVVLEAERNLPSSAAHPGHLDVKLLSATTGHGPLSGRFAISSVTLAQAEGSQEIEVSLLARTCNDVSGFGGTEDVVVPPNQTVELTYPTAVRMPFVGEPKSWCLYASTLPDGGLLTASVVATKLG